MCTSSPVVASSLATCVLCAFAGTASSAPSLHVQLDALAKDNAAQVIAWRRDIHRHPELSNRELRTATLVAQHLRNLRFDEVRTGVAHTGVVGVLRGKLPGSVIALRADMDALPVTEELDLPFASKDRTTYNGRDVGVMHACGHDAHTAILMGVASVLAAVRERLPGTVVFLFQPAEEGPPAGERGGARLMIAEDALDDPAPKAIFGLHVATFGPAGTLGYRSGAVMGDESNFRIVIHGRGTHAGRPWRGIDPITIAAQLIVALQTIPSRQLDLGNGASLITLGTVHGGTRRNIIPDEVELTGTFRTLNPGIRDDALERIRRTSESIVASAGARATIEIVKELPVTYNDPQLTAEMVPTLERIVTKRNLMQPPAVLAAEDFSFYQQRIPGLFFWLGIYKPSVDPSAAEDPHSPRFLLDEDALVVGVRAMSSLAVDYLQAHQEH